MAIRKFLGHAAGGTLGFIAGNTRGARHGAKIGGWLASRGITKRVPKNQLVITPRTAVSLARSLTGTKTQAMPVSSRRKARGRRYSKTIGYGKRKRSSTKSTRRTKAFRRSSRVSTKKRVSSHSSAGFSTTSTISKGNPRWARLYKDLAAPLHMTANHAQRITAASGVQSLNLINLWRAVPALLGLDHFTDIRDALAASVPPPPTLMPNQQNTRKYMVQSVVAESVLKNDTTIPITIWIYDVTPRRDIQTGSGVSPIADWQAGLLEEQIVPAGATGTNISVVLGSTPFQSRQFTTRWKVKNVTKLTIDGGSEHRHTQVLKFGGLFDPNRVNETDTFYSKGVTHLTMIVMKGGIIRDSVSPFAVSTSQAALDIVTTTRVVSKMLQKSGVGNITWNSIVGVATTQQFHVNEESDIAQVVTVA